VNGGSCCVARVVAFSSFWCGAEELGTVCKLRGVRGDPSLAIPHALVTWCDVLRWLRNTPTEVRVTLSVIIYLTTSVQNKSK
jgi:hypothetical protein